MSKEQVRILFDLWPQDAEWFVVGGPADDLEAQTVVRHYPHIKCVGFEPNKKLCKLQNGPLNFPGVVHPYALWKNETDELTLTLPTSHQPKRGSVCRPFPAPDIDNTVPPFSFYSARPRTLDSLSDELGPFNNVVLWLDIEYAELPALEGASKLLERTLLVNVESFSHLALPAIIELLLKYNLILYRMWNVGATPGKDAQDYVFVKLR